MIFWWREHHLSFEQECEYLRSLGFGVEIWPTMKGQMECRYEKRNWPRLKDSTHDMTVAMHSRYDGPTAKEWDEQLQCAQMLSALLVTDLSSLCISEKFKMADWGFVEEVVGLADKYGVTLCVENGNLDMLLELGSKFDSIRYCFDTGHAHLDTENTFKEFVDGLGDRITYLHLTDNYGEIDDHEPPGVRGGIDKECWDYLLNRLQKHDNDIIAALQMIPTMPSTMIHHSSKFLFDVMGWPDQPQRKPDYDEYHYRPI